MKEPNILQHMACISTYSFIATLCLLDDSPSAVSRLSCAFQLNTVDLSLIQPLVLSTQSCIQCLKNNSDLDFQSDIIAKVESRLFDSEFNLSSGLVSDEEEHEGSPMYLKGTIVCEYFFFCDFCDWRKKKCKIRYSSFNLCHESYNK